MDFLKFSTKSEIFHISTEYCNIRNNEGKKHAFNDES
jgi:hypothetical protein